MLAGIVFFFAYNWADLHRFAKLGITGGLLLISVMISLSGSVEEEIGIEYTGLQPGEKLAEELFSAEESRVQTSHPKVCCIVGRTAVLEDVERLFNQLKTLPGEPPDVIRECLRRIVPEYRSSSLCGPEGSVVEERGGDKSGAITERSARGG